MNPPDDLQPQDIARLVDRFYDKVRGHPTLGPVFNAAVHDWAVHKELLTSFWSSVALKAASYRGNAMAAHRAHPISAEHFDDWLGLWRETTAEELAPVHATQMYDYAQRIGQSLRHGLGLDGRAFGRP